jgi:hypothetical protein
VSHAFVPSADGNPYCAYEVQPGVGCGFPASNRRVHAPGAPRPEPERLASVHTLFAPARLDGAQTSVQAAVLAAPRAGSLRQQLLDIALLRDEGITDHEAEGLTGRLHQSVSSARNWLVMHGWLHAKTDEDGSTITRDVPGTGRPATVWTLTDAARRELAGAA